MATQNKIFLRPIDELKDKALTKLDLSIKQIDEIVAIFDRNSAHNLLAAITLLQHEKEKLLNRFQ